jgi:hypothetical protein
MKGFSGIADVDLKILENLDDPSLFRVCSVNKELFRICNKEPSFWKNRFIKKYGLYVSKSKPENRSWKDHYMQTFIYLQKYKNKPIRFLDNIIWRGTIDNSYYLDLETGNYMEISKAPEEIRTNFWLLDLGTFRILNFNDEYFQTYSHITPAEFLPKLELNPEDGDVVIIGLKEDPTEPDSYLPSFVLWNSLLRRLNERIKLY